MGEPITVGRDLDGDQLETIRKELETQLDLLHERAYQRVGAVDPGRDLGTGQRS
jgi:hypothetical protein